MNLKLRFSLLFSFLFSVLLAAVMLIVYYLFSNFRKEEFEDRMMEKAQTTIKLLLEVKEIDYQLLKLIDRNTINNLYNEKILVFDDSMRLIYSSLDDIIINWSSEELDQIKKKGIVVKRNKGTDIVGIYFDLANRDYYVLVAAEDKYGKRKLNYLKYLLAGAFVVSTSLIWLLSFYLSKKSLAPLDKVRKQIQDITDKNLNTRLNASDSEDEISALSHSFNQMMDRIDKAYNRQKEFTGNASHELRTPIARIVTQLENIIANPQLPPEIKYSLKSISEDSYQLSDMVTSLLLLSEMEDKSYNRIFQPVRLDEIVFATSTQLRAHKPDFKLQFEIENTTSKDASLEIKGDETLLKIAVNNLFKNAYAYSDDKVVQCTVRQQEDTIQLLITNKGKAPEVSDPSTLFNTFTRGSNTANKPGSGVGLSIVYRILQYHNATVVYSIPDPYTNVITVTFTLI